LKNISPRAYFRNFTVSGVKNAHDHHRKCAPFLGDAIGWKLETLCDLGDFLRFKVLYLEPDKLEK